MNIRFFVGLLFFCLLTFLGLQQRVPGIEKIAPIERIEARVYQGHGNSNPWIEFNPQRDPLPALVRQAPHQLVEYRYHLRISAYSAAQRHDALLLTQAVNGIDIVQGSQHTSVLPLATAQSRALWHRPALVHLPDLKNNPEIILYTRSWEPHLFLAPIYAGRHDALFWANEAIHFVSNNLAYTSTLLSLLFGLFFFNIWLSNKKDRLYLFVAFAAICWCILFFLTYSPIKPTEIRVLWRFSVYAMLGCSFWAISKAVCLYNNIQLHRYIERLNVFIITSGPIAHLLVRGNEPFFDRYWTITLYLVVAPTVYHLIRKSIQARANGMIHTMTIGAAICLFAAYQSRLFLSGFVDDQPINNEVVFADFLTTPIYLINLVFPLFFIIFASLLVERHRSINKKLMAFNELIKEKLQQQALEINLLHADKMIREKQEAAEAERNTIYRDLHDGIGARLVSCLYKLREKRISGPQIEDALMTSLIDIRKIMSASPSQPINDFVGHLFERCMGLEDIFTPDKVQFTYQIPHDIGLSLLHRMDAHIMYIFQEVISNFIKHSSATQLHVSLNVDDALTLCIVESAYPTDGSCLKQNTMQQKLSGGHGLANIHARATAIAAELDVHQDLQQRVTRLVLPLSGVVGSVAAPR
jgi:signal transduction histidine kinase